MGDESPTTALSRSSPQSLLAHQRLSIGMANLVDITTDTVTSSDIRASEPGEAAPLPPTDKRAANVWRSAMSLPSSSSSASSSSPSSSTLPSKLPLTMISPRAEEDDDGAAQIRRAAPPSPVSPPPHSSSSQPLSTYSLLVPPPPPTALELYMAIANHTFFAMITTHGIHLCGSDTEAAALTDALRARRRMGTTHRRALIVVNVNAFQEPTSRKTLLHQACRAGDPYVIQNLLYHGANAQRQCAMGRTPFHDTVSSGPREQALASLLLLYAHEPDGVHVVDRNGTHVLHLAAIHGCLEVVQWCASLAATTSLSLAITSFSGRNALHYAAYNGRLAVLQWLLRVPEQDSSDHGHDHNERANGSFYYNRSGGAGGSSTMPTGLSIASLDSNGYSVLHYAAMGGHLEVCQWLVCHAPTRHDIKITAPNSGGQRALDLAKQPELQAFLEEVSQLPAAPRELRCLGADRCSLGIAWYLEPPSPDKDPCLRDVLAPKWFELEYCRKPSGAGQRRASALLAMTMLLPSSAATALSESSASAYLLKWEKLGVLIQPEATVHWLTGLEGDCEYLVRMRVLNRNGYSAFSVPSMEHTFTTTTSTSSPCCSPSSWSPTMTAGALLTGTSTRRRSHPGGACDGDSTEESDAEATGEDSARMRSSCIGWCSAEAAFIGTLDLEVLEARRLLLSHDLNQGTKPTTNRSYAARQGRFYGVVTLSVPTSSTHATISSESGQGCHTSRHWLYRVRSDFGTLQQDLLLSGSLHAFRHPRFALQVKLRVPEASNALLTVEIYHESLSGAAQVVGEVEMPLRELVRGYPAKMQWLALQARSSPDVSKCSSGDLFCETATNGDSGRNATKIGGSDVDEHREHHHQPRRGLSGDDAVACRQKQGYRPDGELLVRSLFLADGITELPHPTRPGTMCSTAAELLREQGDKASRPSSSAATTQQSSTREDVGDGPLLSSLDTAVIGVEASKATKDGSTTHPPVPLSPTGWRTDGSHTYDALGFRVFHRRGFTESTYASYTYYRLHQECMARQQEQLWRSFHCDAAISKEVASSSWLSHASLTKLLRDEQAVKAIYQPSSMHRSPALRQLVWDGGIPASCRRRLYMQMSGAQNRKRAAAPRYFHQQLMLARSLETGEVCAGEHSSEQERIAKFDATRRQIQVDLKRTFAGNRCWVNTSEGQAAMQRVLLAFAVHNEHVGYCQSMSFTVARLLCLFHAQREQGNVDVYDAAYTEGDGGSDDDESVEEDVFWMLVVLCEDYFPTNYIKGMAGLHVDGLVLETLLQQRLPKVIRHFQVVLQCPPQIGLLLVTGWLLPVFCAVFPSETSLRLLDVVIFERSSVVFALVLALLRMAQPQLIEESKDYMHLFRMLKERDQRLHDTALLMEIAYEEHAVVEHQVEPLRRQFERTF